MRKRGAYAPTDDSPLAQHSVPQLIHSCVHMRRAATFFRPQNFLRKSESALLPEFRGGLMLNALNDALNGLNVHLCRCGLNDLNMVL